MSTAISHDLTLGRVLLTLPQSVPDPQLYQWQRHVTDTLERISLYPAIPPQAILIVRQLNDPLPGELLADRIRNWEQAAQTCLEYCWRGAVRPARVPVPASANAVWFADQAEWMTCLSWDIHQGIASERWWWQSWLQSCSHLEVSDALMQLWQPDVQWLPQTLTLLYERHRSGLRPLLTRLNPAQVTRLRQDVVLAYKLSQILSVESFTHRLEDALPDPLQALAASLPWETQALVVLCYTLLHRPQALASLSQPPTLPDTETLTEPSGAEPGAILPKKGVSKNDLLQPTDLRPSNPPQSDASPSQPNIGDHPLTRPRIVSMAIAPTEPAAASSAEPSAKPNDVDANQPDTQEAVDSLPFVAESEIVTVMGGLWYLVNVLMDLDWLPTEDPLNGWHKLQGLAQAMLPEVLPDIVWGILAELAEDEVSEAVLDRWVNTALPQVERYLSARLEQPELLHEFIGNILLEPATLYVTRTHIDVLFTLEQIRLDVRQAGLDRDPGWVPKLARAIAFHYE